MDRCGSSPLTDGLATSFIPPAAIDTDDDRILRLTL
jgi:hypothetical protein